MTREPLIWSPRGVLSSGDRAEASSRLPPFPDDLAAAAAAELDPELLFVA